MGIAVFRSVISLTEYVENILILLLSLLADRTACSMIGYWHDDVVCPSVCLSVTLCIVALAQGGCRELKVVPLCSWQGTSCSLVQTILLHDVSLSHQNTAVTSDRQTGIKTDRFETVNKIIRT